MYDDIQQQPQTDDVPAQNHPFIQLLPRQAEIDFAATPGLYEALVAKLPNDNKIVICGRNENKLKKVADANKKCVALRCRYLCHQ